MTTQPLNNLPIDQLFDRLVDPTDLAALIESARREDLAATGDLTARLLVPEHTTAVAAFRARRPGTIAGTPLLKPIAAAYDPDLRVEPHLPDGAAVEAGTAIATLTGPLRSTLAAERVMLNFLTHLAGVASLTRQHVDAISGTPATIYDTRKTLPGLRTLQKYAVRCGGGLNHRLGLHDALLVKDNHFAHIPPDDLPNTLSRAIEQARHADPAPAFIEIEVDTLDQLRTVLQLDLDIALLDNMPPDQLAQAVALRDQLNPNVQLEASGGIDLETVRATAEAGVDRIAIGALTHSAPALDVGLDLLERHD